VQNLPQKNDERSCLDQLFGHSTQRIYPQVLGVVQSLWNSPQQPQDQLIKRKGNLSKGRKRIIHWSKTNLKMRSQWAARLTNWWQETRRVGTYRYRLQLTWASSQSSRLHVSGKTKTIIQFLHYGWPTSGILYWHGHTSEEALNQPDGGYFWRENYELRIAEGKMERMSFKLYGLYGKIEHFNGGSMILIEPGNWNFIYVYLYSFRH